MLEDFYLIFLKELGIELEQAEREVQDLHQRTKEGIETARLAGKQIGQQAGRKLNVKKSAAAKEIFKKHAKEFRGSLTDAEFSLTGSKQQFSRFNRLGYL